MLSTDGVSQALPFKNDCILHTRLSTSKEKWTNVSVDKNAEKLEHFCTIVEVWNGGKENVGVWM